MKMSAKLLVVAFLGLAGCGMQSGPEEVPTHVLYGKLTSTSVNVRGKSAYVKVVEPGKGVTSPGLFSTPCIFDSAACDYRIDFIPEGEYSVFAFIDMNDNSSVQDLSPDISDLFTRGAAVILWANTKQDFPDSSWSQIF